MYRRVEGWYRREKMKEVAEEMTSSLEEGRKKRGVWERLWRVFFPWKASDLLRKVCSCSTLHLFLILRNKEKGKVNMQDNFIKLVLKNIITF